MENYQKCLIKMVNWDGDGWQERKSEWIGAGVGASLFFFYLTEWDHK